MANRFWVTGGSGNWNATDTNNWAASSGGTSGASVPTSSDAVFFDGSSGSGTATIPTTAVCQNFDCTGYTGTLAFSASATLTTNPAAGGTVKLASGMTLTMATGATLVVSVAAGSAASMTNAGKSILNFTVQGSTTGSVSFADAQTVSNTVTLTQGGLNTNGQTCTWGSFSSSNSNTRTLTMGASVITITSTGTGWNTGTVTGLTVTANTATVTLNGAGVTAAFGSYTGNGATFAFTGGGAISITGSPSLTNLTLTGTAAKTGTVSFSGNPTVTGTFTTTGNSLTNRVLVQSSTVGTARTITAATVSLTNVDFMDITGAGAATWSGTSVGDCHGNTGITFTTPVTRYAVSAGNWSSTGTWSASSGGSTGASVPLPQDTVNLDANSGAGTYTADMPRLGKDINCTGFTRTLTVSISGGASLFGNLTLVAGMTVTSTNSLTFCGRGSQTIDMGGKSYGNSMTIQGPGGTYTLLSDLSMLSLTLNNGTFTAGSHNVSALAFSASGSNTRTLNMGTGIWSLSSTGVVWSTNTTTGLTFNSGTSQIVLTNTTGASKTFNGGGLAFYSLACTASGSGGLAITGNNTFVNLDVESTSNRTFTLPAGGTQTVTGVLTLAGN